MADAFPQPPFVKALPQSLLSAVSVLPTLMIPPWGASLQRVTGNPVGFMYRPGDMNVIHASALHLPQPPVMPANYPSPYEWVAPGNPPNVIANRNIRVLGAQLPQGLMPQEVVHPLLSAPQCKASQPSKSSLAILNVNCYGQLEPAASRHMLKVQPHEVVPAWTPHAQGQQVPLISGAAAYVNTPMMLGQLVPRQVGSIIQSCSVLPHPVGSRGSTAAESAAPRNGVVLVLKEIQQASSQKPPAHHVTYYPVHTQLGGLQLHPQGVTVVPILQNACGTAHSPRGHFIQQSPTLLDSRWKSDVFVQPTLHRDNRGYLDATTFDFQMAMRPAYPSHTQPGTVSPRQKKVQSSPVGQKESRDGLKTVLRGKSSESPADSLEAPLGKIEIPNIQQILAYTDPLCNSVDIMPERGPNNPSFTEDTNSCKNILRGAPQISEGTPGFTGSLHRGAPTEPALEIPPPPSPPPPPLPKVMCTVMEKDNCVLAVTQSGNISSSTGSREKQASTTKCGDKLARPVQPGGNAVHPAPLSGTISHLSRVPEISTLEVIDIVKKNLEIPSKMKPTDVSCISGSKEPRLKASTGPKAGKDFLKKTKIGASSCGRAPANQLENTLCIPEPAKTTGALPSDARSQVNSTSKRKKVDSQMPLAKKAKSQGSVPHVQESLLKTECVGPEPTMGSTTVLPLSKPKAGDKPKRKRGNKEVEEQKPPKLHRSHLRLHMFESVQVFHQLGKKGEGTGAIPVPGNPAAPLSMEGHPKGTTKLLPQPHEKSLLGAQRDLLFSDKAKCSNKSALPGIRENMVANSSMPLSASNNARPGMRNQPGKEVRNENRSRVSSMSMSDSKRLADKQTVAKERDRSPPGKGVPLLKDPGAQAEKVNQHNTALQFPLNRQPAGALQAPIQPALNYQCIARPPAVSIEPATAAVPGQTQIPGKVTAAPATSAQRLHVELEVSIPISRMQRPEREAMKKRAQYEREHTCQYTAMGKLQFFLQRENDMEVSESYGFCNILMCLPRNYLGPD